VPMTKLTSVIPSGIRRRAQLTLHQGTRYHCPFCGYAARDLRPRGHDFPVLAQRQVVGGGSRPSACYNCGSSDRERLIYLYLKDERDFLTAPQGRSVLHIAPEKRLSKAFLGLGFGRYECGDLFTPGYRHPDHVRNMNVMELPFEDDLFDLVLCNHVLEHIEQDDVAMAELHRVLAPGGFAILQVPISRNSAETLEDFTVTDPVDRERTFGQFDHVRIYGQDYVDRLAHNGFTVQRVKLDDTYGRFGVNPDEELFVCSK
jgi:SAM-dependent methyltransferase